MKLLLLAALLVVGSMQSCSTVHLNDGAIIWVED